MSKKKKNIIIALYVALFTLVPLLAFLQYKWLGELSEQEKSNFMFNLESDCHLYTMRVSDFLQNLYDEFFIMGGDSDSLKSRLSDKMKVFRSGKYSGYVKSVLYMGIGDSSGSWQMDRQSSGYVYLADSAVSAGFPDLKASINDSIDLPMPAYVCCDFKYLVLKLFPPGEKQGRVILVLDREKVIKDVIEHNFGIIIPEFISKRIIFSVVNGRDSVIFTNDHDYRQPGKQEYDFIIPIGMIHGPMKESGDMKHGRDKLRWPDRKKDRGNPFSNEQFRKRSEKMIAGYELRVAFKQGQLESLVDGIRYRNLAISFSVLILLTIVVIMIAVNLSKRQKLAELQMQFVAGVSHELRTPLTVIRSAAQNLSDGIVNDSKKALSYGDLIVRESDKLWDMIETTLAYAGVRTSKPYTNFVKIDLIALIKEVRDSFASQLGEDELTISVEKESDSIFILGNEQLLFSAFRNIMSNSVKFSEKPAALLVKIYRGSKKSGVIVRVSDNGRGIPQKELARIFEPFFRGSAPVENNIPGNGIGLSIVKNAVGIHKGTIRVESKPGSGTDVFIELPEYVDG